MAKRKAGRNRWTLLLVIIIAVLTIGMTLAFMFRKTGTISNTFEPGDVSCNVEETFDGTNKTSIKVAIAEDANVDAFVRVRFVSYWVDKDGNVVGKPSEMPEISYNSNYWIKSSNEYEYYCINDVSPGEQTPELLKANIVLSSDIYDEEEVYQVVDVFAEAIQSNPVSAVESAWKVEVGDAAGKIEKVL